jgi:hypothetical protein
MMTPTHPQPVPALLPHLASTYGPVPVNACCELTFLSMRIKQEGRVDPGWVQDGLRALGRSMLTKRTAEGSDELDPTRKAFLIHLKSPGQVDMSIGQVQNIVVVQLPPKAKETYIRNYGVICGNRRVAAAKLLNAEAGKELIPTLKATIFIATDADWDNPQIRFKFQLIAYAENNARQDMDAAERIYWLGVLRETYESLYPDSKKPGRVLPRTPDAVLPPKPSRFDTVMSQMIHASASTTRTDGKYFHQMSRQMFDWWHLMGLNVAAADEIISIPKPLQGRIRELIESRHLDPTLETIRMVIVEFELRELAKAQQPTIDQLCPQAITDWWDKELLPFEAAEVLAQVPRVHQPKVLAALDPTTPATATQLADIVMGIPTIQAALRLERARAGLHETVFDWWQSSKLSYEVAEAFFKVPPAVQPRVMETLRTKLAGGTPAAPAAAARQAKAATAQPLLTGNDVQETANQDEEVQKAIFESMKAEAEATRGRPGESRSIKTDCKNCEHCQMIDGTSGQPTDCAVFAKMLHTFAAMTQTCLRLCDDGQISLPAHLVPYVKRATLNLLTSTKSLNLYLARAFPAIEPLGIIPAGVAAPPNTANGPDGATGGNGDVPTSEAGPLGKTARLPARAPMPKPGGTGAKNGQQAH